MSSVVTMVIEAKNRASAAFDRVGKDAKKMAGDGSKAFEGLQNAQTAWQQALSGNLVGAIKSASMAVKNLFAAMLANPFTALAAGIAVAIGAIAKYISHTRQAAEETRKAQKEAQAWRDEMEAIGGRDASSRAMARAESFRGKSSAKIRTELMLQKGDMRVLAYEANEMFRLSQSAKVARRHGYSVEEAKEKAEQYKRAYADAAKVVEKLEKMLEAAHKAELDRIKEKERAAEEAAKKEAERRAESLREYLSASENMARIDSEFFDRREAEAKRAEEQNRAQLKAEMKDFVDAKKAEAKAAKDAVDAQKKIADKAAKAAADARERFLNKNAAKEDRERENKKKRDDRALEIALEKARKGKVTGPGIEAAIEAGKKAREARLEAEALAMKIAEAEKADKEYKDAVKNTAEYSKRMTDAVESIDEKIEDALSPAP